MSAGDSLNHCDGDLNSGHTTHSVLNRVLITRSGGSATRFLSWVDGLRTVHE